MSIVVLSVQADAYTIKQGTVSIGASAYNENRNFDQGTDSHDQYLSVSAGYFLQDNIEIGAELSHENFSSSSQRYTAWSLSPSFRYHQSLDERSSLYGIAGIFFTSRDATYNTGDVQTQDSSGITLGVGCEYFFNPSVAVNIGLSYSRVEWNIGGSSISSDKEDRFYWPQLSVRVFL